MSDDFASKLGLAAPEKGDDLGGKLGLSAPGDAPPPAPGKPDDLSTLAGIREHIKKYLSPENKAERDKEMGMAAGFAGGATGPAREVGVFARWMSKLARKDPMDHAITAREAGYVLPPSEISKEPTALSQALTGWGGKIKTRQAASQANQEVTNKLAAKSLGLPENTTLSEKVFADLRAKAGEDYEAIKNAYHTMTTDGVFKKAIGAISNASSQAAQIFPEIMKNPEIEKLQTALVSVDRFPTDVGIEVVKKLRQTGNTNLKAIGDPAKHALGLAQRQAADAVDGLFERNLNDLHPEKGTELVDKYRKARQLIARSYDVEGATNAATGDVSARGLARLADKGRPLGDDLETIANAAKAFPRAMQNPSEFGGVENWSALDFFGAAGSVAAGRPGVAWGIAARPIARAAVLSKPYQDAMTKPAPVRPPFVSGPTPLTNIGLSGAAQLSQHDKINDVGTAAVGQ